MTVFCEKESEWSSNGHFRVIKRVLMKIKHYMKFLPLLLMMEVSFAQTTAERLEQGVQLQIAEGDMKAAIEEYQLVVQAGKKSDKLVAEARYRLAQCYETLGNEKLVMENLNALRDGFPRSNKWVLKGDVLRPNEEVLHGDIIIRNKWGFEEAVWKDERVFLYRDRSVDGVIDYLLLASRLKSQSPEKVWEFFTIGTEDGNTLSQYECIPSEGAGSIKSRSYDYSDGEGSTSLSSNKWSSIDAIPQISFQMVLSMGQEVGTKRSVVIGDDDIEDLDIYYFEVVEHVDVVVPAGEFSCAKISMKFEGEEEKEIYIYVSRGANPEIVRLHTEGYLNLELMSSEKWDIKKPWKLGSKELAISLSLPGSVLYIPEKVNNDVYRLQLFASDLVGSDGFLEVSQKKLDKETEDLSTDSSPIEPFEIDGVQALAKIVRYKVGENFINAYEVRATGEGLTLSFRLNYVESDKERVIAKAREILEGFRWKSLEK